MTINFFLDVRNTVYVCLRKYRGLKTSGYGVVDKMVSYEAFQLTITFKQITDSLDSSGEMFLVVVAVPVYSSYKGIVFDVIYLQNI